MMVYEILVHVTFLSVIKMSISTDAGVTLCRDNGYTSFIVNYRIGNFVGKSGSTRCERQPRESGKVALSIESCESGTIAWRLPLMKDAS